MRQSRMVTRVVAASMVLALAFATADAHVSARPALEGDKLSLGGFSPQCASDLGKRRCERDDCRDARRQRRRACEFTGPMDAHSLTPRFAIDRVLFARNDEQDVFTSRRP